MADRVNLTKRQAEMLAQAASRYGVRDHTRYETDIMDRLYVKGLALPTCNGTEKWFATQAGRALLASNAKGE